MKKIGTLGRFFGDKAFESRSLKSQEKLADSFYSLAERIFVVGTIWTVTPFIKQIDKVLSEPNLYKSLGFLASLKFLFLFDLFLNSFFYSFWLLGAALLFLFAGLLRNRALNIYDKFENNKKAKK